MPDPTFVRVAVPVPLRKTFDFLLPAGTAAAVPGARVRVPFGRRHLVGVITAVTDTSDVPAARLKPIERVLDVEPVFGPELIRLLDWTAEYYHHPLGEVYQTALPSALRGGGPLVPRVPPRFRLTARGAAADPGELNRARAQQRILLALQAAADAPVDGDRLRSIASSWRVAVQSLCERGWVETCAGTPPPVPSSAPRPELNDAQRAAAAAVIEALGAFRCFLLHGITGSGKTEVYLRVIESVLERGGQALVLVPEIGLTPQLVKRFRERLPTTVVALHSGLSDGERHFGWWSARRGEAGVVLGTRSAVFTPLHRPAVIIVDEEHDTSFKQQDGLRYHARDLAVYRARLHGIPIVLGSATPSLETLANAEQGRYAVLRLPARAGRAALPTIRYVDLRRVPCEEGLSRPLIDAVGSRLERGEQSLIFVNRRGFAPVLFCTACTWQAHCHRCDAKLTYHQPAHRLRCHHCGHTEPLPEHCPECQQPALQVLGQGTQRIEALLARRFPAARIVRIDRDNIQRKGELEAKLAQVNEGEADILVGTQLLAKGHDFPRVTLVGVINADQGLYGVDFRAVEYLFQQIVQVAGRAGRADHPGEVLVQTMHPDHPHFSALQRHDYLTYADAALQERRFALTPPYTYFALLRAESTTPGAGLAFLAFARDLALAETQRRTLCEIEVMDPVPSPMEKRAGRYRAQLLVSATRRSMLHRLLAPWLECLEQTPEARRVRWSIDVDPMEMY